MELASAKILPRQRREETRLHRVSMSSALLGIDWQAELPVLWEKKTDDSVLEVEVASCSYEQGKAFLEQNHHQLFGNDTLNENFLFFDARSNSSKDSYYRDFVDHFIFKCNGETIGYSCIHLQDWSTYYLRYINILPQFRGHRLVVDYVEWVAKCLEKVGVERIETHVAVHNASQLAKLVRMGFMATGSSQSERWGSMVQLTRFLGKKQLEIFKRQYCL